MGKTKQREAELVQELERARAQYAPARPLVLEGDDSREIEEAKKRFLEAQKKLQEFRAAEQAEQEVQR
jgi:hypothetical protein